MKTIFVASLLILSACQSVSKAAPYPSDWWKEIPRSEAAGWEILPQDAKPGEVILSKRTELGIFSNFAATPFEFHGQRYASVEGFWQMLKYPEGPNDERLKNSNVHWAHTRAEVGQMTGFEAKGAGSEANANMKKLGIEWLTFEGQKISYLENSQGSFYQLIYAVESAKLEQNPAVQNLLRKTGNLQLLPDHHQDPNSAPAWRYYEIWMNLRQNNQTVPGTVW